MAPMRAPVHPAFMVTAALDLVALGVLLAVVVAANWGLVARVLVGVIAGVLVGALAAGVVAPARGAVDWPLIWAWTSGANVPVMLFMLRGAARKLLKFELINHRVNLRELGRERESRELGRGGILQAEGLEADEARSEKKIKLRKMGVRKRAYYSPPLGPMDGSGVNWIDWVVDTSTLGTIVWRRVCWANYKRPVEPRKNYG